MNKKNVLIIAPHADDEVLGCGGYISKNACKENIHIIIVAHRDLSRIDNIRNLTDISNKYNVKYHLLNYIDERLDVVSSSDLVKQIERIYFEIKPYRVFIPFDGDINSDHVEVHKSCIIAFRKIQEIQPKELLMYEIPSSTTQGGKPFFPNTYNPLTCNDIENKWDMLSYYKSEVREYPNPRSKVGIETYGRFRGMECNRDFAEGYITIYKIEDEIT
jgi:LmbE family N-acetylglucosaminyl deacetylase